MNRHFVLGMIVVAGLLTSLTTFAQQRPYDQIMKDIGATSESLRTNLDGTGAPSLEPVRLDERGGILRNRGARRPIGPVTEESIQVSAAAAVEDATKLEELFREIEQFWTSLNTQDAVKLAKTSHESAATIVEKIEGNDFDAAQIAFRDVQQACIHCHFTHRERTIDGFFIRP
jgi:hypothetical protein